MALREGGSGCSSTSADDGIHDMAKLVRGAGWRGRGRPSVTREDPAHLTDRDGQGAGDASRYTSRLDQRSPPCLQVSSGTKTALGVASPLAPRAQPRCPAPPSTSLSWEARGRGSRRPRDRPGPSGWRRRGRPVPAGLRCRLGNRCFFLGRRATVRLLPPFNPPSRPAAKRGGSYSLVGRARFRTIQVYPKDVGGHLRAHSVRQSAHALQ
jgi:hypothetical protein